jgi:two-component system, LytTR family, response regulator
MAPGGCGADRNGAVVKTIIVDDEAAARKVLRDRCAGERDIEVIGEYADAESALAALPKLSPDLIFLDVKMGKVSGMQLAQALEPGANAPLVVFVTAFDRYALQAFEVNAADFLLKPFDRERFRTMLRRVRERHAARNSASYQIAAATLAELQRLSQARLETRPRLLADTGGALHMVDVAAIELVTADRNYVVLTVGKEAFHARSTLIQAEESMRSQPMLPINRSCMVNLNHVRQVSRTPRGDYIFVLSGGTTVTSSERFRHKVRERIGQFAVGGLKD